MATIAMPVGKLTTSHMSAESKKQKALREEGFSFRKGEIGFTNALRNLASCSSGPSATQNGGAKNQKRTQHDEPCGFRK